jgi:hypothetical protein
VLAAHPDLRQRLITAIVPEALRSTVESSLATLPTSAIPFVVGLAGLLLSGTGVVFSAYQTLNHVAAVRYRFRGGFVSRYVRVFVVLAMLLVGAVAVGALTVVATALPGQPGVQRAAAVLGSALVVFAVFALLYLVGQALVYAAEVAAVRYDRLWPRALDSNCPTSADARALGLLAREQERIPAARVETHLAGRASPPVPGGPAPANDSSG